MANTIYRIATVLTLAGLTVTTSADELTKEITIEKDIAVQEREARKLTVLPRLNLPSIESKKLKWT